MNEPKITSVRAMPSKDYAVTVDNPLRTYFVYPNDGEWSIWPAHRGGAISPTGPLGGAIVAAVQNAMAVKK